jgi:pyridoxal phosphate enzyme (YggS family)
MNDLSSRVAAVRRDVQEALARSGRGAEDVILIAASKGTTSAQIEAARRCGLAHFGENRVQEAEEKFAPPDTPDTPDTPNTIGLPSDLPRPVLHLIGPLQTNKVRKAVGFFDLIHSVDRLSLAEAISREAGKRAITQAVLVQVNIGAESTKHGVAIAETPRLVEAVRALPALSLLGLMAIPPQGTDPEDARPYFARLREIGRSLGLTRLSIGMSGDFQVAIEEGAAWIRVGSALFGRRN